MKRIATAFVLVLALTGCYGLPPATESAVRDAIAANEGHVNDQGLPQSTREVAQDNRDVLYQILYGAGVIDELPADVRRRMDDRKKAREAAAGGDK